MKKRKKREDRVIGFFKEFFKIYMDKDVFLYSSNASYFFMMAIVPISMLIFSTISLIPNSDIDELVNELEFLIPSMTEFNSIITLVVGIAKGLATKSVISINVILAIIASSAIIHSLSIEIRNIHGHFKDETFLRARVYSIINIFLIQIVTVFLVVLFLFGNRVKSIVDTYLPFDISIVTGLFNFRYPIAFIVLLAFLMSIYTTSTRFKRSIKHNIFGAIVSSILWILISNLFSIFFTYFPLNKSIYGAFSSIIIVMMWLLTCVNVIFVGNIINEMLYPQKEIDKILKKKKKIHPYNLFYHNI